MIIKRTTQKDGKGKCKEKGEEKVADGIPHAPYNARDAAPAPRCYDRSF
jgi:hypothetical protein